MAEPVRIIHLVEADSTNSECQRRAQAGETGPLWVMADRQTSGRGRLGRDWQSASGNLTASMLFMPELPMARLAEVGFVAAVAVAETLQHFVPDLDARLKWPNDVLVHGAKICGILPETGQGPTGNWLVLGVGINLVFAPDLADKQTCALSQFLSPGQDVPTPHAVLAYLALRMQDWLQKWQVQGFAPVRAAWLTRAHGLGQCISVPGQGQGVFEDMNENGALLLRLPSGQVIEVRAGEIFFA